MRMNSNPKAVRYPSWLARLLGMFNLNDGRWGRDTSTDTKSDGTPPEDKPTQGQAPQGNSRPSTAGGPPDLDELWRDFNRKLSGLLGGGKGGGEPPKGVVLDTLEGIKKNSAQILIQAVQGNAMPLGNETGITDNERAKLGAWIASQ